MADAYVPYDGPIVTRAEAKAKGLPRYFTAHPCKRAGHVVERFTSGGSCRECLRLRFEAKRRSSGVEPRLCQPVEEFRAKRRVLDKRWKAKNRARLAAESSAYYWANKEACDARNREAARRDPVAAKARARRRRARKRGASGSHTVAEIEALAVTQKYKCVNCQTSIRRSRHIDHIKPLARGGSDDIKNIQLLCPTCNHRKRAKDPIDWAQENGRLL